MRESATEALSRCGWISADGFQHQRFVRPQCLRGELKHATRKKKFLAKALVTERRSNELRVFSLLLLLSEGFVPLLSELFLSSLAGEMPRIWMNIEE